MADATIQTAALDGLNLERLLELRRERRRIDAEIAALVTPLDATTMPTWGPCTRCGHVWRGKSAEKPGHCAGCSSAYWDREPVRKRAGAGAVRKRSRKTRRRTGLPLRTPTIREVMAGPPPQTMTPPPAAALSIVPPRPLPPPPMWTPPREEPQPEAVASAPVPVVYADEFAESNIDAGDYISPVAEEVPDDVPHDDGPAPDDTL